MEHRDKDSHDSHNHEAHSHHGHHHGDRHGAKQPHRFDPARAAMLDDPSRFEYLPPAEIFELLDAPKDGVVVDFGTGLGTYAIELARQRPDLQVIAFDEQPEMLAMMKAKPAVANLKNLRPVLAGELHPSAGFADRVLALNVLHEIGDEALSGLAAMLKPGGMAVFADWNAEVDRPVGPSRDHVHTPAEACDRIEKHGMRKTGERLLRYHYVIRAVRTV